MKQLLFLFLLLAAFSCKDQNGVKVEWVDNLEGDFSLSQQWDYAENVLINAYGELVCDGICDPALDKMRDENGKIIPDSINRYYQLLDTTHHYYTLQSEALTYEWAGTNYAEASIDSNNVIRCHTLCNAATHSSLKLTMEGNECFPHIELLSISHTEPDIFPFHKGYIKIDKALLKKDTLKAEFDFTFTDHRKPQMPMWWRGKIYTQIHTR